MTELVARTVSILGHPLVVMPVAVLALMVLQGDGRHAGWALAGLALLGALIMLFSRNQVRRGHWQHVDASGKQERSSLNRFLLVLLVVATLACLLGGASLPLTLGLGLSATIGQVFLTRAFAAADASATVGRSCRAHRARKSIVDPPDPPPRPRPPARSRTLR